MNVGALPKKLVELERKQMHKSSQKKQSKKLKNGERPPDSTNVQQKSEFWGFPQMNPFGQMGNPYMQQQFGMMNPWMQQPNMFGGMGNQFMMPNPMMANQMMHHQQQMVGQQARQQNATNAAAPTGTNQTTTQSH